MASTPSPADELHSLRRLTRPFGHARLACFFLVVGVVGGLVGAFAGSTAGAVATAVLGFTGVVLHRMRVNPIRWRETEEYLDRIRREGLRYRTLLEGAADMLLVVDPHGGRVGECNALARRALGLEVVEGRVVRSLVYEVEARALRADVTIGELVEPRGQTELAELLACARRGEAAGPFTELPLKAAGGGTILVDARVAVISLGEELSALVSLRDVTHQKALERELQIRERLSSIGLMTAGVAHDINNPLEGIANYLRLAARAGLDDQARTHYLERVEEGFGRIRGLARELLRFARPEGEHGDVDLSEVIRRARRLASFAPDVQEAELEVEGLEQELLVLGDAGRLEQVVFNLITNAAAAVRGAAQKRVQVSARRVRAASGPEEIELCVTDTGGGIPREDLDRIFDPFFSRTGGAGLGLAVCYATLVAHGGTIRARNRDEGGAEFTFRLPAAAARAARPDARSVPEGGTGTMSR